MSEACQIYVACLSAYNNGHLWGEWIDVDRSSDEIMTDIKAMLSRSPMAKIEACEDWAIHSYEGFKGITIGEYESIDRVVEIAQKLKEHGEAFAAYLDHYNVEDIDDFEDRYQGNYESKRAFTEEHYSELIDTVEKAGLDPMYIDFEVWARDLFTCDFTGVREGYENLYVFRNG
jgi:antirestriction protein